MATRISTAARNAAASAIGALLNGGTIEIRTGSQPATPAPQRPAPYSGR